MRKEGKMSGECGGTTRPCFAIISGEICVGGRFRRRRGKQAVAGALTDMQRLHLGAEIRLCAGGEGRGDGERDGQPFRIQAHHAADGGGRAAPNSPVADGTEPAPDAVSPQP